MYGFSFKTIIKSFFTEGPLNKLKKRIRSPPLTESYEDSTGLSSMITIRPVDTRPFVSLDSLTDYLVVLRAFHTVQSAPDFLRRTPHFATLYQLWAQGAVSNYRKQSDRRSTADSGLGSNYDDCQQGYYVPSSPIFTAPICSSPVLSSPVPAIYDNYFDTPDTGIMTPGPDMFNRDGHRHYFPSSQPETSKTAPWGDDSGNEGDSIDSEPSLLFSSRSNSTHVDHSADYRPLPLPPLTVLMAWHAHMMQPDQYACALQSDYSALRDVPFPFKEAAQAIRSGSLPTVLDCYGRDSDIEIGWRGLSVCDLAQRIASQAAFLDALHEAGYLQKDIFNTKPAAGLAAIARYHGFLELLQAKVGNGRHMAHTLDIQLVWQCHLLDHTLYEEETTGFADSYWFGEAYRNGRWVNPIHTDVDWFDETSRQWAKRFKGEKFLQPSLQCV